MHIITMLFLLSILVLVHELGHFSVARMLGITVERFGFGLPFGPTLFETTWGKTKIVVHAFLLGGYVAFPDDDPDSDVPDDDPGRISNRKPWERFLVIIAGVTANIIIAFLIVLFVGVASGGVPSGDYKVIVDGIQTDKTLSASSINIKPEDKIVSANGVVIDSPYKFIELAKRSKKFDNYVSYDKISAQTKAILNLNPDIVNNKNTVIPKGTSIKLPASSYEDSLTIPKDGLVGISEHKPDGQKLSENQQKLRNSLSDKDYYISDGQTTLTDLATATGDTVHPINIVVDRNGEMVQLSSAYPNKEGVIGIKLRSEEVNIPVTGPISSIKGSWDFLYRNTNYMVSGLGMIVTGQIPFHDLHGIVAITKVGSDIIEKRGLWDGLLLTALISIDLAIVNILPIPALDGGHLLFLAIEKLRGRPVNEKTQEAFAKFGFLFLIGLMIFIIFNDILALVTDKI
ncbi:MAG: RIP metalloprotease RseP [Candidatus Melainabacteria bacterium RIFOXYA2_FULL_32_9]|nr:MAG: RIP metalloprotease RseP [Candidatus Melainabacteria bacterium RIFOXYA2_FULL_32_9]